MSTLLIWCNIWVLCNSSKYLLYLSLLVSFLDSVSSDVCVAIILGWSPLQSSIEAPGIHQLYTSRRTRAL